MRKTYFLVMVLLMTVGSLYAQKTVSGKVTDQNGDGLPGVTVVIKGTASGVTTDIDGNFQISVQDNNAILVISSVGMTTQEVAVGNRTVIDVALKEDIVGLQEVVVTAFGLERDKDQIGYSAQNVNADALVKTSETNILNAMNGKVAGVVITKSGGAPAASTNIVIRGGSSISGNNQPLFVIDGIPIDNTTDTSDPDGLVDGADFNDYGKAIGTNRVSDLNPSDIESMTVLKGGAATALYGIRAVNGAVIITTKSGNNAGSGLNVNLSTSYTVEKPNKFPQFQESFARGRNGAYSNVTHWSWGPAKADNPVFPAGTTTDLDGDGTIEDVSGLAIPFYSKNYERFWQTGSTAQTNISVSSSNEKSSFYSSIGVTDQTGIIPNSKYKKYNFSFKNSTDITDKLTVGGYASFIHTYRRSHQGGNNGFGAGLGSWHNMWDIDRPYKNPANGEKVYFSNTVPDPNWTAYEEAEESIVDRFIGNFNFSYSFTNWLTFRQRVGIDAYVDNKDLLRPISSPNTTNQAGDFYEIRIASRNFTSSSILNANRKLGNDINMNVMVGYDVYDKNYDRIYAFGEVLAIQGFRDISNTSLLQTRNTLIRKRIFGLFGEVAFDWRNQLFLSVTGRNDKSSTLPANNNSFFYPSVNLGYIFTETLGKVGPIDFGKIKVSYAQLGNDAPEYLTSNTFSNSQSITGSVNTNINGPARFSISNIQGNPLLKPEISTAYEIGAEIRAFDGYLGIDVTYYNRLTKDQVLAVPLSPETGYAAVAQNAGEVENKGIEAIISYNNVLRSVSPNFDWSGFINYSKNTNEVLSVPDGLDEITLGYTYWWGSPIVARPGLPLGTILGGGFKRNEKGQLLLDDNGYPQATDDNVVLGNYYPDWIASINNSFSYKGIRLDATLEIKKGGKVLNDSEANWVYYGLSKTTEQRYYGANVESANATRVFPGIIESTGEPSTIAAPLDNDYYHGLNSFVDEAHIEDASWVRLRTVSLSYTLPKTVLGDGFVKGAQVTFVGNNLWLKTDYSGVDPETNALGAGNLQGVDMLGAPNTKSYGVSLNVKF